MSDFEKKLMKSKNIPEKIAQVTFANSQGLHRKPEARGYIGTSIGGKGPGLALTVLVCEEFGGDVAIGGCSRPNRLNAVNIGIFGIAIAHVVGIDDIRGDTSNVGAPAVVFMQLLWIILNWMTNSQPSQQDRDESRQETHLEDAMSAVAVLLGVGVESSRSGGIRRSREGV